MICDGKGSLSSVSRLLILLQGSLSGQPPGIDSSRPLMNNVAHDNPGVQLEESCTPIKGDVWVKALMAESPDII